MADQINRITQDALIKDPANAVLFVNPNHSNYREMINAATKIGMPSVCSVGESLSHIVVGYLTNDSFRDALGFGQLVRVEEANGELYYTLPRSNKQIVPERAKNIAETINFALIEKFKKAIPDGMDPIITAGTLDEFHASLYNTAISSKRTAINCP